MKKALNNWFRKNLWFGKAEDAPENNGESYTFVFTATQLVVFVVSLCVLFWSLVVFK